MKFISFLLLTVILSCSQPKRSSDINTVTLKTESEADIKIDSQSIEDDLIENTDQPELTTIQKEPISLIVYSSMYNSLAFFYYLKSLEQRQIEVSHIISNGFAFLLSALYARDKNLSTMEWKLFALLKKLSAEKIYSKQWLKIVMAFASEEFKSQKLSDLKLHLSYLVKGKNEKAWNRDVLVTQAIRDNINLNEQNNFLLRPQIFDHQVRAIPGIQNIYSISFMSPEFKLEVQNDYIWGVLTNYLSFIVKHQNISTISSKKSLILDKLYPMPLYNAEYKESITENVDKISTELDPDKEINSPSSI